MALFVLAVSCGSCDYSEAEKRFLFAEPFEYRYTAKDSTGSQVATGVLNIEIDLTAYGCTTSTCGDVSGQWYFARVGTDTSAHQTGRGRIDGTLTNELRVRFKAGPDSRQRSAQIEFEAPVGPEVNGTWVSTTGEEGGTVVLREQP